jgi:hypothetical protein
MQRLWLARAGRQETRVPPGGPGAPGFRARRPYGGAPHPDHLTPDKSRRSRKGQLDPISLVSGSASRPGNRSISRGTRCGRCRIPRCPCSARESITRTVDQNRKANESTLAAAQITARVAAQPVGAPYAPCCRTKPSRARPTKPRRRSGTTRSPRRNPAANHRDAFPTRPTSNRTPAACEYRLRSGRT